MFAGGWPAGSTLTRPGAWAASVSNVSRATASPGVEDPNGGTVPSPVRENTRRPRAELRLSQEPAHQSTTW